VVAQQAAMIAYIDDFKLMMIIALVATPLMLLIREPARAPKGDAHAAAME
jgi:MFS transporter, DHA2 family, multidrug resistance protein